MKTTLHATKPAQVSQNLRTSGPAQPDPRRTPLSFYFLMGVLALALVFFLVLPFFM